MKSAAEANVDTAKDAATLRMHQEMNGNAGGGMHPAVVGGLMKRETASAGLAWKQVLLKGKFRDSLYS